MMNSRQTAEHTTRLHLFRHTAPKSLSIRQYAHGLFGHSDEKSDCAIYALELIIVYLASIATGGAGNPALPYFFRLFFYDILSLGLDARVI